MLPALREDFKRMKPLEPAHGPLCQRCLKEAWAYGLLAGQDRFVLAMLGDDHLGPS